MSGRAEKARQWRKSMRHDVDTGIKCELLSPSHPTQIKGSVAPREGDRFSSPYKVDETTGEVSGCPTCAPMVVTLVHAAKLCDKSRDGTAHNHAEVMTVKELQQLMQWSERACPNQWIKEGTEWKTVAMQALLFQHALFQAFSASAYTLWTQ